MADKLSVNLDDLSASATKYQGHGDDLAVSHAATHTRIAAVGGGWTGDSAQALTAWAATLKIQSAAMVDRLGDHSQHMHSAVHQYGTHEEQRSQDMAEIDRAVGPPSGS